jgi:hypothetical protein
MASLDFYMRVAKETVPEKTVYTKERLAKLSSIYEKGAADQLAESGYPAEWNEEQIIAKIHANYNQFYGKSLSGDLIICFKVERIAVSDSEEVNRTLKTRIEASEGFLYWLSDESLTEQEKRDLIRRRCRKISDKFYEEKE